MGTTFEKLVTIGQSESIAKIIVTEKTNRKGVITRNVNFVNTLPIECMIAKDDYENFEISLNELIDIFSLCGFYQKKLV